MKAVILGGGISGLSAAWHLHQKHPRANITLLEKKGSAGGWIQSQRSGPFLFELGPRTFQVSRCKELLSLIHALGLKEEIVESAGGARYLLKRGKLRSIPSLFSTILSMLGQDLFAPRGSGGEESIASFAERRFGKEGAEQFFDPMALGVFAGDFHRLSLRSCFPFLAEWESRYRSIALAALLQKRQKSGLFTLKGGMHRIAEEIVRQTPMELHLNTEVDEIRPDGVVAKGRYYEADLVLSALPAEALCSLLSLPCPISSETFHVVNLGYLQKLSLKGYGYLVPSREREALLGMIWDTSIFPVDAQTKLTAMVRSERPLEAALDALKRHLGVDQTPDAHWTTPVSVPQYTLGHAERIDAFRKQVQERLPNLLLLGNYLKGASVNACIAQARYVNILINS